MKKTKTKDLIKRTLADIETGTAKISVYKDVIMSDLDKDLSKAASLYAFYTTASFKMLKRYKLMEAEHDGLLNKLIIKIRKRYGELNTTEAKLKANGLTIMRKFKSKMIKLDINYKILSGIAKAIDIKSKLLQTKASNLREEFKKTNN